MDDVSTELMFADTDGQLLTIVHMNAKEESSAEIRKLKGIIKELAFCLQFCYDLESISCTGCKYDSVNCKDGCIVGECRAMDAIAKAQEVLT